MAMIQGFSFDYDKVYENFKELCLQRYGKYINDKDPVVLQFLMQELFTKELASRLSEFVAMSNGKLNDLADIWKEREDQSFKALETSTEAQISRLNSVINNEFRPSIVKIFQEVKKDMKSDLKSQFDSMQKQLKIIGYIAVSGALIGGFSLGMLLTKYMM